jgi:predicted transcriptional regulator
MENPTLVEEMVRHVEEVMQRQVVTVSPDTSVRELLRVLAANQISGLPVVSAKGKILGVVSATDVIRLGSQEAELPGGPGFLEPLLVPREDFDEESAAPFFLLGDDWIYPTSERDGAESRGIFDEVSVEDIMTPAAFTVGPRETVGAVAKFLLQGRIHRALVVEGEKLEGIVTAFDLLKAFVEDELTGTGGE